MLVLKSVKTKQRKKKLNNVINKILNLVSNFSNRKSLKLFNLKNSSFVSKNLRFFFIKLQSKTVAF